MEITLRKADAFSKALIAAGQKALTPNIELSIYSDKAVEEVVAAQAKLATSLEKSTALLKEGFYIRQEAGRLNASSGINDLLRERAALEAQERLLTPLSQTSTEGLDGLTRRLEVKLERTKSPDYYGNGESVTVSAVTDKVRDAAKAQLLTILRRKGQINDELLETNIRTKVKLTGSAVSLLTEMGLI